MDDDEELRSQCFGGDYPAQSFDQPVMKRYLSLPSISAYLYFSHLDNVDGGMHIFYSMKKYRMINPIQRII